MIWKLDRLGHTVKGLVEFVADLREQGVSIPTLYRWLPAPSR